MAFAKISQAAYYVPSQVVTNDDLSKIMDTSDEWIASRTGIKERRISQTEDTGDLASRVAEQLLQKAALKAEEIDFIIVATITPDSMMPSTAARVQAAIGAVNAFAFDLTAACSGFIFALSVAEKLIKSGQYRKGLVIGAEVLSKTIDWTDRATAVLFGDGAGGVLLEADSSEHFLAESIHSDGRRGESLTSGNHAISSPFSQESEEDKGFLKMDGRAIFDFAIRDVSKSISALIEQSGFLADDIDCFLLHQANIRILDKMAKKINADREKFPANMMSYGNTSAASIPILLAECVENGTITFDGSQTVLLSGFGGGLTWGSLIVKI
ncbi:beta-ketoacyl-ACP synthase III [Streptococcus ratti]|uniref:Beta-ketoacyl-[acyl-carrier-protein] synthase III n=1 Tax=Streptococcus ratti FA-1 = DSM 20564 TaxID=699248 RepID=A0ABN0GSR1_STRRT|nr:beta-ketoacyl-ACP synthase III [Streptococcus ratti]EJN93278.1 3-oxoacyl-(acyl carrier protein) synthase III [Streptococcus ratti FA-1 = DSM 20564]EMP68696.1 3-oxoacyl-(acyl carrier protein) synthase III [Streptococcus ratti FA-1 = DSM 20564]QEY07179.1 ketoacyl-ACP synthase III [Streptococcus ratti]VEI59610.1 3-oxoacyl-ACP synthase [Streptococcus mutans]